MALGIGHRIGVARSAFAYVLVEGWRGFRRNGLMSAASVTTLTCALTSLGASVLLLWNLHRLGERVESQLVVVAYLRSDLGPREVERALASIRRIGGSARFVSRQEALRRLERVLGGVELGDVVRSNPLPDTIEVRPRRPAEIAQVASALRLVPGVEEVTYGGTGAERVLAATRLVRWLGGGLTLLLGSVAGVVIVSTVRLTVLARRTEVEIMGLVGASHALIRGPFLVEGALQGTCAALLALLLLGPGYVLFVRALGRAWPTWPLLPPLEALPPLGGLVLAAGIGTALVGSAISIRRFLRS